MSAKHLDYINKFSTPASQMLMTLTFRFLSSWVSLFNLIYDDGGDNRLNSTQCRVKGRAHREKF